jgi:hypothetical protein
LSLKSDKVSSFNLGLLRFDFWISLDFKLEKGILILFFCPKKQKEIRNGRSHGGVLADWPSSTTKSG